MSDFPVWPLAKSPYFYAGALVDFDQAFIDYLHPEPIAPDIPTLDGTEEEG